MPRPSAVASMCMLLVGVSAEVRAAGVALQTLAEQSDFKRTGRYEEVVRLCADYQKAFPQQVRCFSFGTSPEGRSLFALAVSSAGVLDAKTAQQRKQPVLLIQGGIHAGEIDGKDAGFLALKDLLAARGADDALKHATLVFVPIFNVDGHERFGPNNRPNQIGPEEMGWRATAQNLNLNRDYIKAEAPEMRAMLRLLNEWDPIVYADLHVTDGAEFEHDISISVSPTVSGDPSMMRVGAELRDALMRALQAHNSLPVDFYPSFLSSDDPASGFAVNLSPPRFSHEYWSRRNRIGVLIETHSWKAYKMRVLATYHSIREMLNQVAARGRDWRATASSVDERAKSAGGREIILAYGTTEKFRTIEFRGYHYTRELSPVSGAPMTRYDRTRPEVWRVPLYDEVKATLALSAPRGGYIIPPAWAALVAEKLAIHGVESHALAKSLDGAAVEVFRADKVQHSANTNEGRGTFAFQGEWRTETRAVAKGSLFVPIAQRNSHLAMLLLEPYCSDSLAAWGYFASAFERKEYMEAYVAEQVALDMLAKDPKLKLEFESRVQQDKAFAASPQARLEFFYRRHPSWDERFNMYPVLRIDSTLVATK